MERCIAAIKVWRWRASRRLRLNDKSSDLIGTRCRLQQLTGVDLNLSLLFGSKLGFSRCIGFTLRRVLAVFGHNSAESELIWMKYGVGLLRVHCRGLYLLHNRDDVHYSVHSY